MKPVSARPSATSRQGVCARLCRRAIGHAAALALILAPPALAQTGKPSAAPAGPALTRTAGKAAPGLVWKVTGGRSPLYLAGSLHFLESPRRKPWPEPLQAAYDLCDSVYFELDSDELNSARVKATIQKWGRLPSGTNLWRIVSPETRVALDSAVTDRTARDRAAASHPWMAAMIISQQQFRESGIHLADGMESRITQRAARDGKEIHGLTPVLEHYRRLARLSLPAQEYYLRSSTAPSTTMAEDLRRMEKAWREGDLAFMTARSAQAFSGNAELRSLLLMERNRSWLPELTKLSGSSRSALVVVGCLHLCGPGSLPDLLRSRGYTVEPFLPPAGTRTL